MSNPKDVARIGDLQIDPTANLNQNQRNELVNIIESEFHAKNTLTHELRIKEENAIRAAYRKSCGFTAKMKKIRIAQEKLYAAQRELRDTGLDNTGNLVYANSGDSVETKDAVAKVKALLDAVRKNAPSMSYLSKIKARMILAKTYGEAVIILSELLGNDVLPSLTLEQAQVLIEAPKE